MKSLKFLLGLVMVAVFTLTACQPQVVTETVVETRVVEVEVEDTSIQIGYAAPALYGGQKMIEDAFALALNKNGWAIITTNADADPQKQNDDIDYLLALGVDAIVTVPEDSAGICAAVEKAKAAGVPFFTIDRSVAGCSISLDSPSMITPWAGSGVPVPRYISDIRLSQVGSCPVGRLSILPMRLV